MNDGASRGIVLVVVAAVIGLVLLGSGLDDSGPVTVRAADDGSEERAPDEASDTTVDVPVTGDFDPTTIPILVANGSSVSGAAGAVTELLSGLGYTPGPAVDVRPDAGEILLDTVYYITAPTSYEAQALQVATDLGLPAEAITEMPNPPPADIGLAAVLVVLGSQPQGLAEQATGATNTPTTVPAG